MKNSILKFLIFVFIFFSFANIFSQNFSSQGADSLKLILNKTKSNNERAKLLIVITEIYLENNLDSAVIYNKKVELLFKKDKDLNIANLQLLKIRTLLSFNEIKKAKTSLAFLKANKISQWKDKNNLLYFYLLESLCFQKINDFKESIKVLDPILSKNKNKKNNFIAHLYLANADAHMQLLNNEESIKNIEKALEIFKKNNYKIGLNKCYVSLSNYYLYKNDTKNALISIKKAQNIDDKIKSTKSKIIELKALGSIYFYKKEYAKTKGFLNKVILLNKNLKLPQVSCVAKIYINLSNYELGNYKKVIEDCKKRLEENTSDYDKYSTYYQLALTYNKLNEVDKVKMCLNEMETINKFNHIVLSRDLFDFLELSMVTENGLGNKNKEYKISKDYIAKFKTYNDILSTEQILKNQTLFETKEKEIQIKNLTNSSTIDKTTIFQDQYKKNTLKLVIVFSFILILISFLLFQKIKWKNKKLNFKNRIIKQQNKQISDSNKTIKKTFSIISHDLRDPFNAILGFSSFILENFNDINEVDLKKYIEYINYSTNKNFQYTQQLLTWSLKQENGFIVNKQNINVSYLIEKSIENVYVLGHLKNIKIENNINQQLIFMLDKDIVSNILHNVLTNAIKFSFIDSLITINANKVDNNIIIEIIDKGKGISKKDIIILNKQSNTDNYNVNKFDKNYLGGFGLLYCKELIELHKGKIIFESVLKEGTKVKLIFES